MSIYLGTVKMSGSAGIAGGDASVIASDIILSTTAKPYITINNSSKSIALPETDPYNTARTPTSHTHGQITNDGKITSTSVSLASGDSLVFIDSSDSSKIKKTSITFDGSTTTKYLSQAGTWVSVPSQTTVSYSPTVTSSTTGAYVIGTLTVNGTNTTIYGKDTTSSGGGGGASYLDDLNDVSTTGATNGQALVYNGSSWEPGTISGGGSWTPTQLSSGFRIWDLDPGIYQMPASGTFYYSGTSGSSTLACTGGMLYVYEEDSVKQWYIMTDYGAGSNNYGSEVLISGYTTSSGGTHNFHYFQSTNEGEKYLGFLYYNSIVSNLNSYNVRLYQPGMCASTLSLSATGKPVNLELNSNTRFVMFTSKDYNNGVFSTSQYLRQDLYFPSLGKHYHRYCSLTNSTPTIVETPNCDSNGWVEEISIPSYTSADAGKCLQVATGGSSLQWAAISGGSGASTLAGLTDTSISSLQAGQILQYVSGSWRNVNFSDNLTSFSIATNTGYDSSVSEGNNSIWRISNMNVNRRNFAYISITSGDYNSYLDNGKNFGIVFDDIGYNLDNYVMIGNLSGQDVLINSEEIFVEDNNFSKLVQRDSFGNDPLTVLPYGTYTLIGVTLLDFADEPLFVVTFGGRFAYL